MQHASSGNLVLTPERDDAPEVFGAYAHLLHDYPYPGFFDHRHEFVVGHVAENRIPAAMCLFPLEGLVSDKPWRVCEILRICGTNEINRRRTYWSRWDRACRSFLNFMWSIPLAFEDDFFLEIGTVNLANPSVVGLRFFLGFLKTLRVDGLHDGS